MKIIEQIQEENAELKAIVIQLSATVKQLGQEAKSQFEAVTVDFKKRTESHEQLEKSFTNLQHSHTQLEGTLTNMSQSLSDLSKSHDHLEKANRDLQRDLSRIQEKQTGVFLSLGCDNHRFEGDLKCIKWDFEKVPLNGKFFLIDKGKSEITIKEKGTYRFDVSVYALDPVHLYINGDEQEVGTTTSSFGFSQSDLRTIRRLDQPNAKVKVGCGDMNKGYKFNTFLIQRLD